MTHVEKDNQSRNDRVQLAEINQKILAKEDGFWILEQDLTKLGKLIIRQKLRKFYLQVNGQNTNKIERLDPYKAKRFWY